MEQTPHISFEFFPPKTEEGLLKLEHTARLLSKLNPSFFSVTFGAGGSTRTNTFEAVKYLRQACQVSVAPHLSCMEASEKTILECLKAYEGLSIDRIVVLRGDMPSGSLGRSHFKYAKDLVAYIRKRYPTLWIEVACYPESHPESPTLQKDIAYFIEKVNCGANSAITQYFYHEDAYYYFVDKLRKAQCEIPVIPGIMPITKVESLFRFSRICGADLPLWLKKTLLDLQDDEKGLKAFGIDFVSRLCENLLSQGAPGLHFYTLNDATASMSICRNLSIHHDTKNLSSKTA